MTNAAIPVITRDTAQLITRGIDTGQMRCGFQTGTIFDAFDDAVRTIALARVGTVGDGDEFWLQAAQSID